MGQIKRKSEGKVWTLPNVMSISRILLLVPFAWAYLNDMYVWAIVILLISGITDIADGFIARRFNMISTLGKVLDPLADKITQVTVAICIAMQNAFIMPTLIVFCCKELLMIIGSLVLLRRGARPSESKWWGKVGTVVIYAYLVLALLSDLWPAFFPEYVFTAASIITISTILYSLFSYGNVFNDVLHGNYDFEKESHNKDEEESE